MNDFLLYVCGLLALVIGFLIIKKITGCIVKVIIAVVLLAIIGYIITICQGRPADHRQRCCVQSRQGIH